MSEIISFMQSWVRFNTEKRLVEAASASESLYPNIDYTYIRVK